MKRRKKYTRRDLSPTFEQGNTLLSKWWSIYRNLKNETNKRKIYEYAEIRKFVAKRNNIRSKKAKPLALLRWKA
jgi:hypothetical protein